MFRKSKQKAEIINTLFEELKCPICNIYTRPPLIQCLLGHNMCNNCCNGDFCHTCKDITVPRRNRPAEGLAELMEYPCRFSRDGMGCTKKLPLSEVEKHEKDCYFRDYKCPLQWRYKCTWVGEWFRINYHLKEAHSEKEIKFLNSSMNLEYSYGNDTQPSVLTRWTSRIGNVNGPFIIHCGVNDEFFHCTLLRAGDKIDYQASFVLILRSRNGKATFRAKCPVLHYENDIDEIISSWDCAKVHIDFIDCVKVFENDEISVPLEIKFG